MQTSDFKDFPLYAELDDEQRESLLALCGEVAVSAGDTFIHQGESGDRIYFVAEGEVSVFFTTEDGEEEELARLTAPAVVGEMEVFTGDARAASVRARTPVRAAALSFEALRSRLEAGEPVFVKVFLRIVQVIVRRLAAMNRKFAELVHSPEPRFHELRDFQQKLLNDWTF
jgi:CRP-like cAMP-binding protein